MWLIIKKLEITWNNIRVDVLKKCMGFVLSWSKMDRKLISHKISASHENNIFPEFRLGVSWSTVQSDVHTQSAYPMHNQNELFTCYDCSWFCIKKTFTPFQSFRSKSFYAKHYWATDYAARNARHVYAVWCKSCAVGYWVTSALLCSGCNRLCCYSLNHPNTHFSDTRREQQQKNRKTFNVMWFLWYKKNVIDEKLSLAHEFEVNLFCPRS